MRKKFLRGLGWWAAILPSSMDPKERISKDEGGKPADTTEFKSVVGGLHYLVHTRLDICYSVGIISRYMEKPTILHPQAAKWILRYIKGTTNYGLVYIRDSSNSVLSGYSDSDLVGHVDDRRINGGMAFYLKESLLTWVSQKNDVWRSLLVKQNSWQQRQLPVKLFGWEICCDKSQVDVLVL